ncbi:hypothetical protein GLOTRDRAFT_129278 [Gloeophyllum trabeum ATCC 11539]|uniref:Uncharacterized protein n=1 Tax=Gloeophyllum trabeum (strain ATCC 11539 / FP-39264 / Madison 617) TaxID=670483 RepID=S7Q659_GLOTA|nr:uncharacterized protein GLOTRDRAFT_129278 [Gloeophyllum trabeum ATCC 11539]EPQ54968.1 hypothetical protein GLOTRDRAFT_129278 [Gloeophyllum trabeum ATCC 11539]
MEVDDVHPQNSLAPLGEREAAARHAVLYCATTVEEVINAIPGVYRSVLRGPLLEVASLEEKYQANLAKRERWDTLKKDGKFPPHIAGLKVATYQASKEFAAAIMQQPVPPEGHVPKAGDEERYNTLKLIDRRHHAFKVEEFDAQLRIVGDELKFQAEALSAQGLFDKLSPLVKRHWTEVIEKASQSPVFTSNEQGAIVQTWTLNPVAKKIYEDVLHDLTVYAHRIRILVQTRSSLKAEKEKKKKELHKRVDAMHVDGDGTKAVQDAVKSISPSASVQSMIDSRFSALQKKIDKRLANSQGSGSSSKKGKAPNKKSGLPVQDGKRVVPLPSRQARVDVVKNAAKRQKKSARMSTGGRPPKGKGKGKGKKN